LWAAAEVLFQFIGGAGKPDDRSALVLSKDKREALRSRFFSGPDNWRDIFSKDPAKLRQILLTFCSLATDGGWLLKAASVGAVLKFARWVIKTLPAIELSHAESEEIDSVLKAALEKLPDVPRRELMELRARQLGESNAAEGDLRTASPPVGMAGGSAQTAARTEEKAPAGNKSGSIPEVEATVMKNRETTPSPGGNGGKERAAPFRSAEQLLDHKRETVAILEQEIKQLSKLIEERDRLRERISSLHRALDAAAENVEKLESQVATLRKTADAAEADLSLTRNQLSTAVAANRALRDEIDAAKEALVKSNSVIESERSEFAATSEAHVRFELDAFKGNLRRKLRPIFENKANTDSFDADAKLAAFLRGWFDEVGQVLSRSGVNPTEREP
jgi:hypothetical protein